MTTRLVIIGIILILAVLIAVVLTVSTIRKPQTSIQSIGLVKVPTSAARIIVSSAFSNGSRIPTMYTCNGVNISIPLELSNIPSSAKSLMVVMEDLNAPGGIFIHWVLYDIPINVTQIPAGIPNTFYVNGIGYQGINDFGKVGYGGPCPPPGPAHEYVIIVLALNKTIEPAPNLNDEDLIKSINVKDVIGYGVLIGYYGG